MSSKLNLMDIYDSERLLILIDEYRNFDLKNITLEEVSNHFRNIFNRFDLTVGNYGAIPLFRVRKIKDSNSHKLASDVWCPKPEHVKKIGRSNNEGESIFYASFDPVTAIKEARIKPGESFSQATYMISARENFHLSSVHIVKSKIPKYESKEEKIYAMILNDFIFTEFTRPVSIGTEYQYKASCAISKILLDLPHKDSLIYPSTQDWKKLNIVIKEEAARERLELKQVLNCRLINYLENGNLTMDVNSHAIPNGSDVLNYNEFHKDAKNFELKSDKIFSGVNPVELIKNGRDKYKVD